MPGVISKQGIRKQKIYKDGSKEVEKFIKDPRFIARMAKLNSIPVIDKYDVPYLCGYAKNAKKIYFDRHLKVKMKGHDLTKFLKIHEYSEKALLDIFGLDYQQAHHIATHLERRAVEDAGINWNDYADYLEPYIKEVSREKLKVVPPDLDFEPYADEKDNKLLSSLQGLEKKETLHETKISLEYHSELNPKLWDGAKLKTEVREALLKFGYTWAKFAKIPENTILDVIMTGGNANYNYTPKSDIDVHLVIDRNALGSNREFVDEYLQDKKVLWTLTHDIKILGYSLEPYAQDNTERYPENQGVYSLKNSRWIQFPNKGNYDWQNDLGLKRKVIFYKHLIDSIINNKMGISTVNDLKAKIKNMRSAAIAKGGEFSFENLVFKELRNRGYLDKLNKYEQTMKDKELSL